MKKHTKKSLPVNGRTFYNSVSGVVEQVSRESVSEDQDS